MRLGKEQAEAAAKVAQEARDKAEAANRAKSDFLANMSHELRTPLNAIIGFSDIIKEQMLGPVGNERYVEYIRDINNSANHLLSVINDILDLSKIEFGNVPLIEENVDLDAVLQACLTSHRRTRPDNGGHHRSTTSRLAAMPVLWAEQRRIKQILINLLSNAVKFTPNGGMIAIDLRRERDDGLAIIVADTGIGIRREDFDVIMAPFGQADTGLNRKFEGTGLGLPLTKAFIEMHGGRLLLDSELGQGTTVTVVLPAKRVQWKAAS
ncbi:MAG: HAMP domain-containing histidine kinase [Gammaproteobacteria bacterium]|nr:HAMP domain-containing histidine kinase [Gammaproteobacteria bacterium]